MNLTKINLTLLIGFKIGILAFVSIPPVIMASQRREEKTLFVQYQPLYNQKWTKVGLNQKDNIEALLEILKKSATGRKLLQLAVKKSASQGIDLVELFAIGKGSVTDTTLIRTYSPQSLEKVEYITKTKIYLNRDLPFMDALLDMAHELTHYTYRQDFNPYHWKFSLEDFIHSTIEGKGGEVDSYLNECRVLYELFPRKLRERYYCPALMEENHGSFSRQEIIKQFYQVGKFYPKLKTFLQKQGISPEVFPYLSEESSAFISSAYGLPYPLAAIKEYYSIKNKTCRNDQNRLSILKENPPPELITHYQNLLKNYDQRCQKKI